MEREGGDPAGRDVQVDAVLGEELHLAVRVVEAEGQVATGQCQRRACCWLCGGGVVVLLLGVLSLATKN